MAIKQLNPYLHFNGTAGKAIKFYESALGAKVESLMPWADVPGVPPMPGTKDLVMHSKLLIGGGILMISDARPDTPVTFGSNADIALDFDDATDMARKFEALSTGGKIEMPLQDTFWGAKFGMLTDVHGVSWMFSCETKKG